MRYAVISDIHSNLEAFQAVLEHIKKRNIKEIICLGDVIGYGPQPVECLELALKHCNVILQGNHDVAVIDKPVLFNSIAKEAILWTRHELETTTNPKKQEFWDALKNFPTTYSLNSISFVHGSPRDPSMEYIIPSEIPFMYEKYEEIFLSFEKILFVGHTHIPCVITQSGVVSYLQDIEYKYFYNNEKIIVNVGSVGQPRDHDNRACYVEVIDDFIFFHRVIYDCEVTHQKIVNIPELNNILGERLLLGA